MAEPVFLRPGGAVLPELRPNGDLSLSGIGGARPVTEPGLIAVKPSNPAAGMASFGASRFGAPGTTLVEALCGSSVSGIWLPRDLALFNIEEHRSKWPSRLRDNFDDISNAIDNDKISHKLPLPKLGAFGPQKLQELIQLVLEKMADDAKIGTKTPGMTGKYDWVYSAEAVRFFTLNVAVMMLKHNTGGDGSHLKKVVGLFITALDQFRQCNFSVDDLKSLVAKQGGVV